ncbi:hypothetical protein L1887_00826 [Cichorium endivia]|nr:hypothetical protein L1887_00826 [Cichorium endivia]
MPTHGVMFAAHTGDGIWSEDDESDKEMEWSEDDESDKEMESEVKNVLYVSDWIQPAKSRWDFLRIVKELNQYVNNDWGGSRPPINEDDTDFLQHKERLLDLEKKLTSASKQQDMAETMGDFGLSFIKLTKYENQQAILETQRKRAGDMKNLATSAIKATRLWRELNSQTVKHLENNRTEIERLDRERKVDFKKMLKGFMVNQEGSNKDGKVNNGVKCKIMIIKRRRGAMNGC